MTRGAARLCLALVAVAALLAGCEWDFATSCMGVGDPDRENARRIEGSGELAIDWANLRNPILASDRGIKDQAVVYRDGVFHLFASGGSFRSRDLKTWEGPFESFGSPDVVRFGGEYVLVHQVHDEDVPGWDGRNRRLAYRTSTDLLQWSEDRELYPSLPHDRNIDGALAFDDGRWVLGFKRGWFVQEFDVAFSEGRDASGEWAWHSRRKAYAGEGCALDRQIPLVGDTITRWAENYQFVQIDGTWRMIATARHPARPIDFGYVGSHEPFIYEMDGSGSDPDDWTRWVHKRHLQVPQEEWNTLMHANSAYLVDWRELDGWFYLFYAGADTATADGRGHGEIGVVRSRDLVHWKLPGDTSE